MEQSKQQKKLRSVQVEELLSTTYASLFANREGMPLQLLDPADSLLRAYDNRRSLSKRLKDLADMSKQVDSLFREFSSPFSFDGKQMEGDETTWSIALARWTELLHKSANSLLDSDLFPRLAQLGWITVSVDEAMNLDGRWLSDYFKQHIYPLLTPLAVDPGRPFPYISSDSLNLLIELEGGHQPTPAARMARLKIPIATPRLVTLPHASSSGNSDGHQPVTYSVWSLELVRHFVTELFVDIPINRVHCFRVLRTSGRKVSKDADTEPVQGRSARGSVVRVDVEADMPDTMFDWLVDHLDVLSYSVVGIESPEVIMSLPALAATANKWLASR